MHSRAYSLFRKAFIQSTGLQTRNQALVCNLSESALSSVETAPPFHALQTEPSGESNRPETVLGPCGHRIYNALRRAFDFVVSLCALILFGLMLPFLALAIKLDSPGSVFFRQDRVGINRRRGARSGFDGADRRKVLQPGQPFRIYKLRTMRVDAEANGPQWAKKHDPRVTRVGRWLRKTRLDEIPQFVNVLRGEMSLIGPRPERLCFIRQLEKVVPNYHERLEVRPGITGLAQVRNGYDQDTASVRRKVELDRAYIRTNGPWTDLKILLETVKVVLTGDGAH